MEGSESEAIFDSFNLNPQLFINEVLNSVDDLLDGAFHYYHQQSSILLKTDATDRAEDLSKGVAYLRNMIQSVLDKRLGMWEQYCLRHCFAVPEGFTIPTDNDSLGDASLCQDALSDPDLDAQLASLKNKLTAVGKESADLNRELRALERQSNSSNHSAGLINKALQLYEENSVHDMFQEMVRTASELRTEMEKLSTKRMEEITHKKMERIYNTEINLATMNRSKGLSDAKLESLQELLADIKKM